MTVIFQAISLGQKYVKYILQNRANFPTGCYKLSVPSVSEEIKL